jgi:lincosamide nucleotidyltransferase B/F
VLFQKQLIARVRELCEADSELAAALMYGSFASGEADEHSDIEFWLFFTPDRLVAIDPHTWCSRSPRSVICYAASSARMSRSSPT